LYLCKFTEIKSDNIPRADFPIDAHEIFARLAFDYHRRRNRGSATNASARIDQSRCLIFIVSGSLQRFIHRIELFYFCMLSAMNGE